jgi:transketolase
MTNKITNRELNPLRKQILLAASQAGEGHIPSALSVLDLLWVIYHNILPKSNTSGKEVDRFILSKGHASLGLYAVLSSIGKLSSDWFNDFAKFNSDLGGHPDYTKIKHVEASTGSLGHGLPIGTGMALANKVLNNPGKVIVLVGDGEINEGSNWESALVASHHSLSNLICIVDQNHSSDRALKVDSLAAKFQSFNWHTIGIDGHNHNEINSAFDEIHESKPTAIIAATIKGWGIPQMENNPKWHHAIPVGSDLKNMLELLT